jgi:hypothetical protein
MYIGIGRFGASPLFRKSSPQERPVRPPGTFPSTERFFPARFCGAGGYNW